MSATIEESLAELAAAHGQRMRGIGDAAVRDAESMTAEMMAHLRDQLKYWRDRVPAPNPGEAVQLPAADAPEMIS